MGDDGGGDVSWRELIEEALGETGETWADIVATTLSEQELDDRFYNSYSECGGVPFFAWSKAYVYFSHEYDGFLEVKWVPRHPGGRMALEHIG